jgi:hypothetical protein
MLAAIRPDSWNFPLFLHVLGAMVLMGGLLAAALALLMGRHARLLQGLGFRYLLLAALPGYLAMRIGAEWIYSKEEEFFPGEDDPAWVGIGYITSDLGALILLVSLIVGGIGARKARAGGGAGLTRAAAILTVILLAMYAVAVWAMAAKPD